MSKANAEKLNHFLNIGVICKVKWCKKWGISRYCLHRLLHGYAPNQHTANIIEMATDGFVKYAPEEIFRRTKTFPQKKIGWNP